MDHKQRNERLRLLIRKLNKERKKRAKQTDLLCNDFIAAQRDFIRKLNIVRFTATFYESILGATDLSNLLYRAVGAVKERLDDANITFFLRQGDNFELHMFEDEKPISLGSGHIENYFTPELMDNICKSNKVCTLDDMFAMGLEGNLTGLSRVCALTVPLNLGGSSLGFILIYGPSRNDLSTDRIRHVCAVTSGLSRAIQSCRASLGSTQ